MNWESDRMAVLSARAAIGDKLSKQDLDELTALIEVVNERYASRGRYTDDVRGVDALERVRARTEKRDLDYPAARRKAGLIPPEL